MKTDFRTKSILVEDHQDGYTLFRYNDDEETMEPDLAACLHFALSDEQIEQILKEMNTTAKEAFGKK